MYHFELLYDFIAWHNPPPLLLYPDDTVKYVLDEIPVRNNGMGHELKNTG